MPFALTTLAPELIDGSEPLAIVGGDYSTIAQIVLTSVLTWKRVDADDVPDGTPLNGWWGDHFAEDERDLGSKLWVLLREPMTDETPGLARDYVLEALAWMLDEGLAAAVEVEAERDGELLAMLLTVTEPDGNQVAVKFADLWSAING